MYPFFNDTETYEKINKDPIKKLTNEIREVLTVWKKKGYIIDNTYNTIYCSDGNLPRAYAYLRSTNQVSHSESLFHQLTAPHIQ